jgi:hypothetical protein
MRAILISGSKKSATEVDIASRDDLEALIGHSSIIADDIDTSNAVYFDEDCFLRGTEGRFVLDTLPPIAGNAVVMGRANGEQLMATELALEQLLGRVKFT